MVGYAVTEKNPIPFDAAILIGGRSRRMGRDKAMIALDGEPLWRRQARLARDVGARRVLLSLRPGQDFAAAGFDCVDDAQPDLGPLSGIASALAACRSSHLLVLAVDMPALTADILDTLIARCEPGFGAIPHTCDGAQPLAAVYTVDCLAPARCRLGEGVLSVRAWAAECLRSGHCVRWDVPDAHAPLFSNWNFPEDIEPDQRT